MSTTNDGGPAFPLQSIGPEFPPGFCGMSLRDYFAAHVDVSQYHPLETYRALEGPMPNSLQLAECIAAIRYAEADAMLAARNSIN